MTRRRLETRRHLKARAKRQGSRLLRKTMACHMRLARRCRRRRKACIPPQLPK